MADRRAFILCRHQGAIWLALTAAGWITERISDQWARMVAPANAKG